GRSSAGRLWEHPGGGALGGGPPGFRRCPVQHPYCTRRRRRNPSAAPAGAGSAAPGGWEDALGDDVALHLGGARRDRAAARVEEEVRPAPLVDGVGGALQQDGVWAEQAERRLQLALVHLAPEELLDGALGAGHLATQRAGEVAV